MVRVTLIKDIFSNTKETFDIDSGITVNNIIEDNFTSKSCTQIEVYNQQTGETRFVEESENDFEYDVIVNDKKVTDFNIPLNDGDNVVILTVPKGGGNPFEWIQDTIEDITDNFWSGMNNGWDAFGWGAIGGALGFGLFGLTGLGIGILAGITISGYQENEKEVEVSTSTSTSKSGKDITDIPDASGARNSSILDKKYPLLLGKHLITPYVCGSPYNETNGTKGKNTYTHLMLCAGYSPLKLTDFKLGDLYLAHNKSNTVSGHLNERETVMHGKLTGYVDNNYDSGDILRRWKLNDVSIEIMQKGGDSSDNSDAYPSVYPQAVIQSSPDATVLFVCDGTIGYVATYKGCSFDSGYRTNSVRFSDSCPSAMEVEISAPNGLYKSRTHTTKDGNNSTTVYEYSKLPIYLAIQWRYYKDSNASSSGDNGSGWTSFSSLNGVSPVTLTRAMIASSTSAHTGNSFPDNYHDYTDNWIGCQVFNLQDFSGEESDGSLSQMRFVARYDFSSAECLKISGLYSVGSTLNADLNSVEVRVIRVDSSYLDETTTTRDSGSGDNYGAYSFNDVTKWSYLRTFKYDEDAFKKAVVYDSSGNITSYPSSMDSYKLRPYNLEDSKKFCFIALKIKADLTGEVNGQLDKINCMAESFAPTYNSATGSWSIPSVVSEYKYYDSSLNEITQEQYEAGIESGEDVTKKKTGNDYNSQLRALLWNSSCYSTANSRYFLPSSYDSLYISNNIASVYLAAMIGTHLGREAKPYSEINMQSVAEAYSFYEDVTDGSTYSESDSEYVVGGTNIRHMRWTFNGYITEATKFETLVQNILNTGRACQTIDDKCRYQIIIDKKRNYPVMLINQQNCISFSNMRSFEDNISGYKVTFQNEDDGYDSSTLYAMMDGEDYKNPTNDVTATSFKYVTNPVQVWSLARYNLARLLVEKEYLERTVGLAGISLQLGDIVNVQDDTILVGTGTGARVQQLIADDAYIYGFVTDELYDYTGEVNTSGKCKLGVKILQPSKWNASRIVTLRMAATSGVTMADGTLLAPVVGKTNNVIFERPIIKSSQKLVDSDDADVCLYLPEVDNIVAFGEVENIISQYIVAKITPQEGFKYKLLLYPYDDSIYSYGSSMPTIQANMTKPNRTGDDNIALSTGVTQEQLNNQITSAIDNATAAVNGTTQTVSVSNITCKAYENNIKISWVHPNSLGIPYYIIRISKDNGVTWSGSVTYSDTGYITSTTGYSCNENTFIYNFDRNTDGYPENTDFALWKISIIAKDASKYFSDETFASVNTSTYKTWIPSRPTISSANAQENGILIKWDSVKNFYGSNYYKIIVKHGEYSYTSERINDTQSTYVFRRTDDGYPESADFTDWTVQVQQCNEVYGSDASALSVTYVPTATGYGTWIPAAPVVSSRSTNRSALLSFDEQQNLYGKQYLELQIKQEGADGFYKPAQGDATIWKEAGSALDSYLTTYGTSFSQGLPMLYDEQTSWKLDENGNHVSYTSKTAKETIYYYRVKRVQAETGAVSDRSTVDVVLSGTTAQDIVSAAIQSANIVNGSIVADKLYVQMLSAITANMGIITDGALKGNEQNYWSLSNVYNTDGTIAYYQGAMRVGGTDQYLKVVPVVSGGVIIRYDIHFKVGNFEVTSTATTMNGEMIVQENADSIQRARITPTGIKFENKVGGNWTEITAISLTGVNTKQVYSNDNIVLSNTTMAERRAHGNDIGNIYPSAETLVTHYDSKSLLDQKGNESVTISGNYSFTDNVAVTNKAPYSNESGAVTGNIKLTSVIGAVFTGSFWIDWYEKVDNGGYEIARVQAGSKNMLVKHNARTYGYYLKGATETYEYTLKATGETYDYFMDYTPENIVFTNNISDSSYRLQIDTDSSFIGKWVHFAIGIKDGTAYFCMDKNKWSFAIDATVTDIASLIINNGLALVSVDELMIDKITPIDTVLVSANTDERAPWGAVDKTVRNFIMDVVNFKTNLPQLNGEMLASDGNYKLVRINLTSQKLEYKSGGSWIETL